MLVSLVPMGALTASAATTSMSEAGITVLKKLEGFVAECHRDGSTNRWSTGYGTTCDEDHMDADGNVLVNEDGSAVVHTISEKDADIAFRAALDAVEEKVATFASTNGLALTQGQFDALVSFTYNCGYAWMSGTGTFKTAVVNGYTGNEFLSAICQWSNASGNTGILLNRRKVEANMYLNNSYSHNPPEAYTVVTLNANGGKIGQDDTLTQYIDTRLAAGIFTTPTREGYTFMGWYDAAENGKLVTALTSGGTLYAYWQKGSEYVSVNYTMSVSAFTTRQPLVKPENYAAALGAELAADTTVTIVEEFIDADGYRWCRVKDGGWLKIGAYVGGSDYAMDVTVTVTNTYVNIRSSSTIYSSTVRKAKLGEQLRIVETKQGGDGYFWGRILGSDGNSEGWVALMYTDFNAVTSQDSTSEDSTTSEIVATATVKCNNYVNVRSGAGTHNGIVGSLSNGTKVNIYEITTVNGIRWGRTNLGWFSLAYADVTMLSAYNTSGTKVDSFVGYIPEKVNYGLHVAAGATTDYVYNDEGAIVELYKTNEVAVTELKTVNGTVWAKVWHKLGDVVKEGWMEFKYISIYDMNYIVVSNTLNVYKNTEGIFVIDTLPKDYEIVVTDVDYVEGEVWGQVVVGDAYAEVIGWIKLDGSVDRKAAATDSNDGMRTATIIGAEDVNVRKDPGLFGTKVTTVAYGTTVTVDSTTESKHSGGMWVQIYVGGEYLGWICTDYLEYVEVIGGTSSDSNGEGAIVGTGIVTSAVGLAVREGAGLGYNEVGRLQEGANVTILEKKMAGGMSWGRISEGWICLSYVQMLTSGTTGEGVMGTVANTYGGLNVRASASTSSALITKLLPGARVEIFEQKRIGNTLWGRTSQGWVSMDYILLDSDDVTSGGEIGSGSTVTASAAFTGIMNSSVIVYKTTEEDASNQVGTMASGDTVTIHELYAVQTVVEKDSENGTSDVTTTTTTTTYWARTNKGFIKDPALSIDLIALQEQVYTVTGSDALNVREDAGANAALMDFKLAKGEQVTVTNLKIVKNTVWGKVKTSVGEEGWASLSYMTKGAVSVDSGTTNNNTTTTPNTNTGSTTTTTPGFTPSGSTGSTSSTGYKYTGKIIRSNGVNIRSTASTNASVTTQMDKGDALVIYETTISEGKAWGRCDAGWVYLYYVDLVPSGSTAIDARIVYNEGTAVYDSASNGNVIGSYSKMSIIDIYEQVGSWVRTDAGWVHTDNLL